MGAEKSQKELSVEHYDIGKKKEKEFKESWEEYREKVGEIKEKIEDKVSKEVDEYLTKEVFPYHKTLGGEEKEKLKKGITKYIVKKITSPLDESVKKTDEVYIQFRKEYTGTETLRERVLNSAEKPIPKHEIKKAYEIREEMEKENE